MRALREKWNSQNGASVLLALLFFLVCMMVAASILMAAVSNAGKLRSNREEQQRYMALSSALLLVCEELTAAEYRGQYLYEKSEFSSGEDGEGNLVTHNRHVYEQVEGSFVCGLNSSSGPALLPLAGDLDAFFADRFQVPEAQKIPGDEYDCRKLDSLSAQRSPYTLTFTPDPGGDGYPGLSGEKVSVTITLNESGSIRLRAVLEGQEGDTEAMEAELLPCDSLQKLLVPEGGLTSGEDPVLFQTEPVKWKLNWLVKKEVGTG